jgi:hypothetical protein
MKEMFPFISLLPFLAMIMIIVVNCLLAFGVSREAEKLRQSQIPLYALDSSSWILVVLFTGIIGFLVFWLIHHSALRDHGLFRR